MTPQNRVLSDLMVSICNAKIGFSGLRKALKVSTMGLIFCSSQTLHGDLLQKLALEVIKVLLYEIFPDPESY